jgi:CBS domain-containing protein
MSSGGGQSTGSMAEVAAQMAGPGYEQRTAANGEREMKANDLMTKRPACVTATDTIQRAAQLMEEHDCGCIPVVESSSSPRVVGVITDRDIAVRAVAKGRSGDSMVRDLMTSDVASCTQDSEVGQVASVMADRQIRRVVILDADGGCVGIVAQADLARAADSQGAVSEREVARVVERISEPV